VFKRRQPRPSLNVLDKMYWVVAMRIWSKWKNSLIVFAPETVVGWHRTGFRLYWGWISRARKSVGRRRLPKEIRELIFKIVAENSTWGAPRIHGELLMLGFEVSERTISRWMRRTPRDPKRAKRWTSSPYQQSPSRLSIASSSSATTDGAFCTSTSRNIPRVLGLFST
jgi:putative transposase